MDLDNNRNGGNPDFFFFDSGPEDIPMDSISNLYIVWGTPLLHYFFFDILCYVQLPLYETFQPK